MDYEKKYKEALERARNIRFGNPNSATANVVCEEIFPELAESDDERTRKELIDLIKDIKGQARHVECYDRYLAWLEKQAEPQPYKGNADTMRKNLIKAFKSVGSNHWGGFDVRDIIYFLESKDAIELEKQGEQKSALPGFEEQEGVAGKDYIPVEWVEAIENYGKWKIVKVNEQKPVWSDEDEEMKRTIISNLFILKGMYTHSDKQTDYNNMIEWLKSLKPQSHWKPTDEQMQSLNFAIITYSKKDDCKLTYDGLNLLYNDLKKL